MHVNLAEVDLGLVQMDPLELQTIFAVMAQHIFKRKEGMFLASMTDENGDFYEIKIDFDMKKIN